MQEIKTHGIRFLHMRIYRSAATLFIFLLPIIGFSQVGIKFSVDQAIYDDWNNLSGEQDLLKTQYGLGIEYWLRLKNVRIEFFPELSYSQSSFESETATSDAHNFQINSGGLLIKTHFYVMDFNGDCDCPTFSKDGNFFTKGFFLAVAPVLRLEHRKINALDDSFQGSSMQIYGQVQLGTGIDFGATKALTITPFFNYIITPSVQWQDIGSAYADPISSFIDEGISAHRAFQFGMKFNYRLDYRY